MVHIGARRPALRGLVLRPENYVAAAPKLATQTNHLPLSIAESLSIAKQPEKTSTPWESWVPLDERILALKYWLEFLQDGVKSCEGKSGGGGDGGEMEGGHYVCLCYFSLVL